MTARLTPTELASRAEELRSEVRARTAERTARARAQLSARAPRPSLVLPTLPTLPTLPRATAERLRAARQRRSRRAAGALGVAVLLALLMWSRCEPDPGPAATKLQDCGPPQDCSKPAPRAPRAKAPVPRVTATEGSARDRYAAQAVPTPPWLAQFRLQVMARSRELARCFDGAERPGALRWSTTVTPRLGTVTGSLLEPARQGPNPSSAQQACVLDVLAAGRYRLPVSADDDLGARVSMVLEF